MKIATASGGGIEREKVNIMAKKAMVYVLRQNAEWNEDFVAVFTTREKVAQALSELLADDELYISAKDIEKHIKEREANGSFYLFFAEELDDSITEDDLRYQYYVNAIPLE